MLLVTVILAGHQKEEKQLTRYYKKTNIKKLTHYTYWTTKNDEGKTDIVVTLLKTSSWNAYALNAKTRESIVLFINSEKSIANCSGCIYIGSSNKMLFAWKATLKKLLRKNKYKIPK